MIELSPLAAEIRRAYYRQYRASKLKQVKPAAVNITGERDRRFWEKKAQEYLAEMAASSRLELTESDGNCPPAADLDRFWQFRFDKPVDET